MCLRNLIAAFTIVICISSCIEEPKKIMEVSNDSISDITSTSAMVYGTIIDIGSGIEEYGHCWSTDAEPTVNENEGKTKKGPSSSTGSYNSLLTGLSYNTKYYVRAYVENSVTVVYSKDVLSFQTLGIGKPAVTTGTVSNITGSGATISGNLDDLGSGASSVSQYGHCWSSETTTPITDNSKTSLGSRNTKGAFESTVVGLSQGTLYYIRAYATNDAGTTYGNLVSFTTTQEVTVPVVTTSSVSSITQSSAVSGGNVTSSGGATVTARGICWNTAGNPTISDDHTNDGSGQGSFTSNITGLSPNNTYYVRAYATNSAGTAYGNQISFTAGQAVTSPVVTTASISSVTQTTAVSGGNITSDGGATVTARGVCWNTSGSPTTSDDLTDDGGGTGSFTSNITELSSNTTYYVRAYATNSAGTSYGGQEDFKTQIDNPTVTDYDGNVYSTVQIGEQIWMAENLATTHYADGTSLVNGTGAGDIENDFTTKYYFNYNDNASNVSTYGRLYTWEAIMKGAGSSSSNPSNIQGVCPTGWHVPSDSEWKELEMFLGISQSEADNTGWRGTNEGGKLKEVGTIYWLSPNTGATNESGFTALPGGHRYHSDFYDLGGGSYWFSATEVTSDNAYTRCLGNDYSSVYRGTVGKDVGYSIRCVKD